MPARGACELHSFAVPPAGIFHERAARLAMLPQGRSRRAIDAITLAAENERAIGGLLPSNGSNQNYLYWQAVMADFKRSLKTVEVKLYPTDEQAATLSDWMRECCWVYNQALEHRIKAYKRRGESITLFDQQFLLVRMRSRIDRINKVPSHFCRGALRRLDRGFSAFFRRLKDGEKPGFPRFKSFRRWNSLEILIARNYVKGRSIAIPKLGCVRFRGGKQDIPAEQKLLRIIKRPSGWYAQLLVEAPACVADIDKLSQIGIDLGLEAFATFSTGERIENPRCMLRAARKLKRAYRRFAKKKKGGANWRKAVAVFAKQHERIAAERRSFCHQLSRRLVNEHDLIAVEDLNIKGLASGRLSKSVNDAAWGIFLRYLTYKAECAGRRVIQVDPRGTSQTCPKCGDVKRKELSERIHDCASCGLVTARDHAAAQVILARALEVVGAIKPVEELVPVGRAIGHQIGPVKQEVLN